MDNIFYLPKIAFAIGLWYLLRSAIELWYLLNNYNHHGFGKRLSCETQLLSTIQETAPSTTRGKQVDVILLDFAKVFDKIPQYKTPP